MVRAGGRDAVLGVDRVCVCGCGRVFGDAEEETMTTLYTAIEFQLLKETKKYFYEKEPPQLPADWQTFTSNIRSRNYAECIEETDAFWGKDWKEISLKDFEERPFAFAFLPDGALSYFLGGYMTLSLTEREYDNRAFNLFEYESRRCRLNNEQITVFEKFLDFVEPLESV
jgi:hypothetical protein